MSDEKTEVQKFESAETGFAFSSARSFASAQRMALALSSSSIVPKEYQGKDNLGNCIVALEMAQRLGISPMMVMQNLYVIQGRPSWSSQFIISAINSCGKFSPLRFEWSGTEGKDDWGCRAIATEIATGEELRSSKITIQMAKDEGWFGKAGSKWKTMPEQMLMYRSSAFFGRIYAPEIMNGMQTEHEVNDVNGKMESGFDNLNKSITVEDIPAEVVTNNE
mgnify:CR=1 FL=1